jgi:hypothetical protein
MDVMKDIGEPAPDQDGDKDQDKDDGQDDGGYVEKELW